VEAGDYSGKVLTGSADGDYITSAGDNLKISAGAGNDTLSGGDGAETLMGGAGSDTLWGGAGNDTLMGGAGSDVFIYKPNEGKDYITDFTADDMLQILNTDGSAGTFTNSSFKNSKLTIAVEGGGHVIFQNISATDTFNINGTTYSISGSKLR
ncbi:MAG: hypothetical protein IKO05_07280, partial [Selenomonadaceae bacterium]|nr:hypothetical protein [Selenomonadaceae bacterium]